MYRILMIEDDNGILDVLKSKAEKWELQIYSVKNFRKILSEFSEIQPHLVIMDIGLPFFDGYYWCAEIRKISKCPILFLSSASDHMNMIMAMNMGGDDFVAKPFDIDVLFAKIQALLRRAYNYTQEVSLSEYREAFLNTERGILTYHDKPIELTKNEHRILLLLMKSQYPAASCGALTLAAVAKYPQGRVYLARCSRE